MTTMRKVGEYESPCWYVDEATSFMQELDHHQSPPSGRSNNNISASPYYNNASCKQEFEFQYSNINNLPHDAAFLQLPQLESPNKLIPSTIFSTIAFDHPHRNTMTTNTAASFYDQPVVVDDDQVITDWRVYDKFVASQLSQDHANSKEETTTNNNNPAAAAAAANVTDHDEQQVNNNMLDQNQSTRSTSELEQEFASASSTTTCMYVKNMPSLVQNETRTCFNRLIYFF